MNNTQAYSFVATYQKIPRGYMGQIVGFPGVISEGKNIEACRESLSDAFREMILAYQQEVSRFQRGSQFSSPYWSRPSLSVKRRDLVKYLDEHGFYLLREGARHSIYSNGERKVAVKRHREFDRITANEICKDAGLRPAF